MAHIAHMYYNEILCKIANENAITHFYNLAQTKIVITQNIE